MRNNSPTILMILLTVGIIIVFFASCGCARHTINEKAIPYTITGNYADYEATIDGVDHYHESDNFILRENLPCGCSKVVYQDDNTDSIYTYAFNHYGIVVEYLIEKDTK